MGKLNVKDRFNQAAACVKDAKNVTCFTSAIERLNEDFPLLYAAADGGTKKYLSQEISDFIVTMAQYQNHDALWVVTSAKSALELTTTFTEAVGDLSLIPTDFPRRLKQAGHEVSGHWGGAYYNEMVSVCSTALINFGERLDERAAGARSATLFKEQNQAHKEQMLRFTAQLKRKF